MKTIPILPTSQYVPHNEYAMYVLMCLITTLVIFIVWFFFKKIHKNNFLVFLLSISCCFISCKKESQDDHINTFPAEIRESVRVFLKEGSVRGHSLNIKKIHHIYLVDKIEKAKYLEAGCYDRGNHSIYIDTTNFEWKEFSGKEMLLYHELGHGLLHRNHNNILFRDELNPVSIMNCCTLPYWNDQTVYKRSYYIDQLFNTNTPYPQWAL